MLKNTYEISVTNKYYQQLYIFTRDKHSFDKKLQKNYKIR